MNPVILLIMIIWTGCVLVTIYFAPFKLTPIIILIWGVGIMILIFVDGCVHDLAENVRSSLPK